MQREPIRLTVAQVREIDRRAIERYGIPGVVLMENAARAATEVAWDMLEHKPGGTVLILCGGGNNGGDGLAIARHLHNRGVHVQIGLFFDPAGFQGDAQVNWEIVQRMRLPWAMATPAMVINTRNERLIIDAIFGTGLNQNPRDPFPALKAAIEQKKVPVLSIDVPSGLDSDTGKPWSDCIRATRTITFVAGKVGFTNTEAKPFLGEVTIGDIGCPKELIEEVVREIQH
jgi:NAD(P)H-hydrate epimerase